MTRQDTAVLLSTEKLFAGWIRGTSGRGIYCIKSNILKKHRNSNTPDVESTDARTCRRVSSHFFNTWISFSFIRAKVKSTCHNLNFKTPQFLYLPSVLPAAIVQREEQSSSITSSAIRRLGKSQFSAPHHKTTKKVFLFYFFYFRGCVWINGDMIHLLGCPWLELCFTWGRELLHIAHSK